MPTVSIAIAAIGVIMPDEDIAQTDAGEMLDVLSRELIDRLTNEPELVHKLKGVAFFRVYNNAVRLMLQKEAMDKEKPDEGSERLLRHILEIGKDLT